MRDHNFDFFPSNPHVMQSTVDQRVLLYWNTLAKHTDATVSAPDGNRIDSDNEDQQQARRSSRKQKRRIMMVDGHAVSSEHGVYCDGPC